MRDVKNMFAEKASAAAHSLGTTTAVVSGVSLKISDAFGWSVADWQIFGIVGGLVIGLLGMVVNASLTAYYNEQRLQLERERMK